VIGLFANEGMLYAASLITSSQALGFSAAPGPNQGVSCR
jgi:hypothetical protein